MRIIKILSEQMEDELSGYEEYSKDALEYKDIYPELAKQYHEMAKTECEHLHKLHDFAVKFISEVESKNVEVPAFMRNQWDEKHKQMLEREAMAKMYYEMY